MMEVAEEMQKQSDKLREIDQKLEEMYDMSHETRKLVNYFKRTVSTDRLIQALIVLISIAIIVIIGMKIAGYKGDIFKSA
jgi:hypothetical protein